MQLGIDLGGTKIEACVLDAAGAEGFRRRIPTPSDTYEGIIDAVVGLVGEVDRAVGQRLPLGIGTPGAISPATGVIKNANSTRLNGRPLDRDLQTALKRPVRVANDADCFALSEATDGAGAGARCVFGVIIGTGTGGGIVLEGRLHRGPNAIAGEWGHNPLPWPRHDELPGSRCYCGRRGCIETWLSGAGLTRAYQRAGGQTLDAATIAQRATQGEAAAATAIDHYAQRLARSLASVVNLLDPDVVVVGGGLSNISALYPMVSALWSRYVFSDRVDTRLLRAQHGDSSGVRGAARLWPPNVNRQT